jgi:hypothetical protein
MRFSIAINLVARIEPVNGGPAARAGGLLGQDSSAAQRLNRAPNISTESVDNSVDSIEWTARIAGATSN